MRNQIPTYVVYSSRAGRCGDVLLVPIQNSINMFNYEILFAL